MDLNQILISEKQTILEALIKLNDIREFKDLILFVEAKDGVLVGSLTDGDIRRSLASEGNVHKEVGLICNKDFSWVKESTGYIDLNTFREKFVKILPVVDENFKLKRILDLSVHKAILPLECIVMAGGRGKRLSPLTDRIPKPMLPLGGKPIIEYNIDRLISFGVRKIYISLNYLGEQIQDYFGDGHKKGIEIEYIREDKPLGTAGALSLIKQFKSENILLMNGDLFTNVNFEKLYLDHIEKKADISIASIEYKVDVPYAVFETENSKVIGFEEKPSLVYHSNAGIYILRTDLVGEIPKNEFFDITELMENLVHDGGKLIHSPIRGFWIDIGNPVDYKQAQEVIKQIDK